MRAFKKIIVSCLMLAILLSLCSCAIGRRKKGGLRNNLKTVDMSKYTQTISNPNTDPRAQSANPTATPESSSATPVPKDNNAPEDGERPKTTPKQGNTGDAPVPTPTPGKPKDLNKPTKAEGSIRDIDGNMITEKYLIYLPTIIESPLTIDRTAYGVTVHFPPTERFDKYVNELIGFGFIQDLSLSESSFSAHTKDGMYVKFIVTAQESWLAIYDDEQHLNG